MNLLIISKLQQLNSYLQQDIEKVQKSIKFWQDQDDEAAPRMIEIISDILEKLQQELEENKSSIEQLRK